MKKILVVISALVAGMVIISCGSSAKDVDSSLGESKEAVATEAPTPEPTKEATPTPTKEPTTTPTPTEAPTPEPTKEAAPTPEPTSEPTPEPTQAPAQEVSASDVDAISNYAASLGYNVYRYINRFGENTFTCRYSATTSGLIFTTSDAASNDTTDTSIKAVLVPFVTSDFVTVTGESVSLSDYSNFNNPITPVIEQRTFTNLETTYKLLEDARGYLQ